MIETLFVTLPPLPEMERASAARDSSYDGLFYVAVRPTGIFCRPSCPARKPKPENVDYYSNVAQAMASGFRPCLRCRPLEATGRQPAWVEALLADLERDPALRLNDAELRSRGLDPATVRRHFLRQYGMTFHAFRRARRLTGALAAIRGGEGVENAAWDAGFESASGFREAFARLFGTPPARGTASDCVWLAWIESPVGPLIAGTTERGVALLEFTDRRALETQLATLQKRVSRPLVPGAHPLLDALRIELADYFAGKRRDFSLPVDLAGTPFELDVWHELQRIPYGATISYEELAQRVGRPGASRAVGSANGRNRIAIVVPCHRVVNKSGELGGYGGGLWRKRHLLDLERRAG